MLILVLIILHCARLKGKVLKASGLVVHQLIYRAEGAYLSGRPAQSRTRDGLLVSCDETKERQLTISNAINLPRILIAALSTFKSSQFSQKCILLQVLLTRMYIGADTTCMTTKNLKSAALGRVKWQWPASRSGQLPGRR